MGTEQSADPTGGKTPDTAASPPAAAPQPEAGAGKDSVDLFQNENFRKYQSQKDREAEQLRRELQSVKGQLGTIQEQARQREQQSFEARLQTLDPEDRAREAMQHARQLEQEYAQREAERQEQNRQQQVLQEAYRMAVDAGLKWDDPRLSAAQGGATADDIYGAVSRAIPTIIRDDYEARLKEAQTAAQRKAEADAATARTSALADAGVLATTQAPSQATPPASADAEVKANLKKRFVALRGKGTENQQFVDLVEDMRKAKLDWDDLY